MSNEEREERGKRTEDRSQKTEVSREYGVEIRREVKRRIRYIFGMTTKEGRMANEELEDRGQKSEIRDRKRMEEAIQNQVWNNKLE